jgi:hypothetical protein
VRFVDLDFLPGRVTSRGKTKGELLAGLGLVVTDEARHKEWAWPEVYPTPAVFAAFGDALLTGEVPMQIGSRQIDKLEREVAEQRELVTLMERSWSWRLTVRSEQPAE